jgi:DNA-directed RNA polymerase specialized sigma subunit
VPRGAQEQALKVEEARHKLTSRTGRSPTAYELAEYMELSVEDVVDGLETAAAHSASGCSRTPPLISLLLWADEHRVALAIGRRR